MKTIITNPKISYLLKDKHSKNLQLISPENNNFFRLVNGFWKIGKFKDEVLHRDFVFEPDKSIISFHHQNVIKQLNYLKKQRDYLFRELIILNQKKHGEPLSERIPPLHKLSDYILLNDDLNCRYFMFIPKYEMALKKINNKWTHGYFEPVDIYYNFKINLDKEFYKQMRLEFVEHLEKIKEHNSEVAKELDKVMNDPNSNLDEIAKENRLRSKSKQSSRPIIYPPDQKPNSQNNS
ncbi:MAG TPA: hypothetical protein DIS94_06000 [Bacteroidetes bacterium]|nr:hypothetical protein [Bacteroidota bacterium]